MIYSGVDLIRTAGEQSDRFKAFAPAVPEVGNASQTEMDLDKETQGGLLRFARFVNKKKDEKDGDQPKHKRKAQVPKAVALAAGHRAYQTQIENLSAEPNCGSMLDITV